MRDGDLELLLDVVRTCAAVSDLETFPVVAAEQVRRLVPCEVVTFNEVDPVAGHAAYLHDPPGFVFPDGLIDVFAALAGQHPGVQYVARTGDGSAHKISDFWTMDELRASALYNAVYAVIGIEYQMAISLPEPLPVIVGIAANRADHDFDERDRRVLNLVRPHLAQAWRNAREQHRLRTLLGAASRALEAASRGVVVLEGDRAVEVTPGALELLARATDAPPGALAPEVEQWLARERRRLDGDGAPQLGRPLVVERDDRRLLLRFLPAHGDLPDAILVHDEPADAEAGRFRALGLSEREAEIVAIAASGASNADIGSRLSIAPGTVKKHLENVYAKLGVSGRVEAAALARDAIAHHQVDGA